MGIPTPAPIDVKAPHGLITREHILESARQNMMNTGLTICRWGTFVDHIRRAIFALIRRFLEDVIRIPKAQDTFFHYV